MSQQKINETHHIKHKSFSNFLVNMHDIMTVQLLCFIPIYKHNISPTTLYLSVHFFFFPFFFYQQRLLNTQSATFTSYTKYKEEAEGELEGSVIPQQFHLRRFEIQNNSV